MFRTKKYQHRWRITLLATFLSVLFVPFKATAQEPPQWTLAEALKTAFNQSPVLRANRAELQEVASHLIVAQTNPYNPELSLELADRRNPSGSTTDRGLNLSQEFEVAGQRRKRMAVANEELAAAEASLTRNQRLLTYWVESAFAEAVRARELLQVAEMDAALANEFLEFSRLRLDRGVANQIEVNLAQASAGRSERTLQRANAAYASARSRLAEIAGGDPKLSPEPVGELVLPKEESLSLERLLEGALAGRGDLKAAERHKQAAEAAIRLALAERRPNLVVSGFYQREESTDEIVGATIGLSIPLFNRNQGRIAESRATHQRLGYQQDALQLAIEQEVVTAWGNLLSARTAAEKLRDVVDTLDDSVELLQRSFTAGRIGATEVVTLRREFVASHREYLEAVTDAWLARAALDLATGRLAPPQTSMEKE